MNSQVLSRVDGREGPGLKMIVQDVMVVMTGENLPPGERVERQLADTCEKGKSFAG